MCIVTVSNNDISEYLESNGNKLKNLIEDMLKMNKIINGQLFYNICIK